MSLSRQLIISILLLFIVLFIGTLSISINNTRTYLVDQLASHAEDAATSLGLSLTPAMRTNDLPTMNSMVDAIFDRGYYREINIVALDGKPMIQRKLEVSVEGVPAWFVMLMLNVPINSTINSNKILMINWRDRDIGFYLFSIESSGWHWPAISHLILVARAMLFITMGKLPPQTS